jgi:hypothetical protein
MYFERNENYDLSINLLIDNQLKSMVNLTDMHAFSQTHDLFHKLLLLIIKQREKTNAHIDYTRFCFVLKQFAKQVVQNVVLIDNRLYKRRKDMDEYDDQLVLFSCYLILYATEVETTMADNPVKFEIRRIIYDLVKRDLQCYTSKYTLLHLVVSTRSNLIYSNRISLATVKMLIECGAMCRSSDDNHRPFNTPLHIAMSLPLLSDDEEDERLQIIRHLLDEADGHIDARNDDGQTPIDCCSIRNIVKQIKPLKYMTLKCFAAQSVRKFNLPYRCLGLSIEIVSFLDIH